MNFENRDEHPKEATAPVGEIPAPRLRLWPWAVAAGAVLLKVLLASSGGSKKAGRRGGRAEGGSRGRRGGTRRMSAAVDLVRALEVAGVRWASRAPRRVLSRGDQENGNRLFALGGSALR